MSELKHVKGLSELQKLLNTLPAKMEGNIMRGALREGAKIVLEEAKQNVAVDQGILRDGLKISTGIKKGQVQAKVKAGGKHGYLARWIEFGTAAHKLFKENGKGTAVNIAGNNAGPSLPKWITLGDHPGAKPKPFMRPALDSKAGAALLAVGEYIKKRLSTKHGLDTSDITIEEIDNES